MKTYPQFLREKFPSSLFRPQSFASAAFVAGMVFFPVTHSKAATTIYRTQVLSYNPVVYYEFDETSGTTAANSATTGVTYQGTLNTTGGAVSVGQASFPQGGTAYDFGGGFVGSASALTSSLASWTVEVWVNYDSAKTSASNFLSNDQGGWNDDVLFGIGAEGGVHGVPAGNVGVVHQDNANTLRDSVASPLTAGQWYHVVMTGENGTGPGTSTLQLFVDGVLVDSDSGILGDVTFNGDGGFGTAPHLTIGAVRNDDTSPAYRPYDGLLDELAIYDRVLTPSEIAANASLGVIPEPASALLLSVGGLMLMRRRARGTTV